MKKLVLDSDAMIKLAKSGILIQSGQYWLISREVYHETVTEGKKRFYEDAFVIDALIKNKKIQVKQAKKSFAVEGIGKGECSALSLFFQEKVAAIVSDDRRFLRHLEDIQVPYVIPSDIIVALVETKEISKENGIQALQALKELISKENFERAITRLGGKL